MLFVVFSVYFQNFDLWKGNIRKWRDGLLHNSTGGVFKLIFIFLDALASLRSVLFTESLIFFRNTNVLLICIFQIFTNLLKNSHKIYVKCQQCQMSKCLLRSVEICSDLSRFSQICWHLSRSVQINQDLMRSD